MKRREVLGVIGGAVAWPLAARAQQSKSVPRLGMLSPGPKGAAQPLVEAVLGGLRSAGTVGQAQIDLVWRSSNGEPSKTASLVMEILASNPDVFFAVGPAVLRIAREATQTIPIVALDLESDPVEDGTVASISHPGGNITGLFLAFPDFTTKWLQLLKEMLPELSLVTVLWDPLTGSMQQSAVRGAAKRLGLSLDVVEVHSPADYNMAFSLATERRAGALLVLSSPVFTATGEKGRSLAELALLHKLPAISLFPDFARAGGLLAYGPNIIDLYRQAGGMIAKVLQGSKPGDLPIERPSKFELVINARTANALQIVFPTSVLVRADEVIE